MISGKTRRNEVNPVNVFLFTFLKLLLLYVKCSRTQVVYSNVPACVTDCGRVFIRHAGSNEKKKSIGCIIGCVVVEVVYSVFGARLGESSISVL